MKTIINIFLVDDREQVSKVLVKSLKRAFMAKVLTSLGENESFVALTEQDFSLIIVRNKLAKNIIDFSYDHTLNLPMLVLGDFEHSYKNYQTVAESIRLEEINRVILKMLNLKKELFDHLKLPEFVPFSVKYFYLMKTTPCSVFIKLLKKENAEYVKRLYMGDYFTKKDLLRYEELGLKEFYIEKVDYEIFINSLFMQSIEEVKSNKSIDENIETLADSYVINSNVMKELGITASCLLMVDQTVSVMKENVEKNDILGVLFLKLIHNKMNFSFRHSYLTSAIAFSLLPYMEWGNREQQNVIFEKICLVSYFHDIYLTEDRHHLINSYEDLKEANLGQKDIEIVLNHAHRAAKLVQSYPKLPLGVDTILKQHHGVVNGVGFPDVHSTKISPLAIFFMVVEDFATRVLLIENSSYNLKGPLLNVLNKLKEKYTMPSYRKVLIQIEKLIENRH